METIYKKKPLFVGRKVSLESVEALKEFGRSLGLRSMLEDEDLHMTVVFSKGDVLWRDLEPDKKSLKVSTSGLELFGKNKNVLVLKLKDYDYLKERNQYYLDNGATTDYPDYKAHVTLSWKVEGLDIDMDRSFEEQITLLEEYMDDIIDVDGYDPVETEM